MFEDYITTILYFSNYLVISLLDVLEKRGDYFGWWLAFFGAFFSGAYHCSQIKFNLLPMVTWGGTEEVAILLNLDRFFAISNILYFTAFYPLINYYKTVIVALCFCGTSELLGRMGYLRLFCLTHLIWHAMAYYLGYLVVRSV